MDSVPQTPDQQTRNAVTRRVIAHVTVGWLRSSARRESVSCRS
jgi:hypothetical protein